MTSTYQQTAQEILAIARRWNRWSDALLRSDCQLAELEELNMKGQLVPESLARSILDLGVEFDLSLPKKLPKSPTKALNMVFDIQVKLFRRIRRQQGHQRWVARQLLRRRRAQQSKA